MTLEGILIVLAIISLSIFLVTFMAVIAIGIILRRKLSRLHKSRLALISAVPTLLQLLKLYLRRRLFKS